ncbi:MAG: MATE family efflux transporter [Clostridia bacterium]|nr:MATE family efflux transporter [Clostridia bacterium]
MNNKVFLRRMLALALPIALQNLLSSCGYLIDTAMVTSLGNVATSAIGVASRWSFLMNVTTFGVCSGCATLIAQSWGAGDHRTIRRTTGLGLTAAAGVALVYVLMAQFFPAQMMALFTGEQAVIEAGVGYIRIASFSLLFTSISLVVSTAVRSTEDVTTPFIASTFGVVSNCILNYGLIYGHFGLPAMGLEGAALATVLAMALQLTIILGVAWARKSVFLQDRRQLFGWDGPFIRKYVDVSAPILLNEFMWALGTTIYSMILARQGSENYAAYTVFNSIHEVFFVFFVGLCNACAIMVGKAIGERKPDMAYTIAGKHLIAIPILSVVLGGLQIVLRNPILNVIGLETVGAHQTAAGLLVLHGLFMPLINIPYVAVVGIFRAGGDTKYGFLIDTLSVYLMGIPVLWFMAYMTNASFLSMVAGMYLAEYILKAILCLQRYKSRKWIRDLV